MPKGKSSTKQPYEMKDGDSLSKFFIMGAISRDDRSRKIHCLVAWHLLERWWEDYGNGWASVSYLENATGLTRGSVATATADLCKWGYFSRHMGRGKKPTAYVPNWNVARVLWLRDDPSVLQPQDVSIVLQSPDTIVLPLPDGKAGCVLQRPKESNLPPPHTSGGTVDKSSGAGGAGLAPARRTEDLSGVITGGRVEWTDLVFELGGHTVRISYEHANPLLQDEGRLELNSLATACGIGLATIERGDEINGHRVAMSTRTTIEPGARPKRRFAPLAANDNGQTILAEPHSDATNSG